jgi:hypothetical protein
LEKKSLFLLTNNFSLSMIMYLYEESDENAGVL